MFHRQVPLPGVRDQIALIATTGDRSRWRSARGIVGVERSHNAIRSQREGRILYAYVAKRNALTLVELASTQANSRVAVAFGIPRNADARRKQMVIVADQRTSYARDAGAEVSSELPIGVAARICAGHYAQTV